jgi:hypothetical protein
MDTDLTPKPNWKWLGFGLAVFLAAEAMLAPFEWPVIKSFVTGVPAPVRFGFSSLAGYQAACLAVCGAILWQPIRHFRMAFSTDGMLVPLPLRRTFIRWSEVTSIDVRIVTGSAIFRVGTPAGNFQVNSAYFADLKALISLFQTRIPEPVLLANERLVNQRNQGL